MFFAIIAMFKNMVIALTLFEDSGMRLFAPRGDSTNTGNDKT